MIRKYETEKSVTKVFDSNYSGSFDNITEAFTLESLQEGQTQVAMKGSMPWMCYIGLSAGVWDGYCVCMDGSQVCIFISICLMVGEKCLI
jgi:hypothetical protein